MTWLKFLKGAAQVFAVIEEVSPLVKAFLDALHAKRELRGLEK